MNFPNQIAEFVREKLLQPEFIARVSGRIFWVKATSAGDYTTFVAEHPAYADGIPAVYTTIDAAINASTANEGDVVLVTAGHTETLATASAITADVAGVTIIGLGEGADVPTLTFSATDSTVVVSGASVVIKNIMVYPSIDSVVSPFVVSGADCELDIIVKDKSDTIEFVRAVLTTADADRLKLKIKYLGRTGGNACVNAVRLVGCDSANIDIDFYGKASTAVVEFHTTLCTDVNIKGDFYVSGTTDLSKNVVDTVGSSTWGVQGFDSAAGARFSGGSGSAVASDDISAVKTSVDAIQADIDAATKVILGVPVTKATATLPAGTAGALFTVAGGRVLVTSIVGEVTTVIQTQANNTKLTANPTTGSSVDMCAVLDITADEVGCLYGITGTPADALVGTDAGLTIGMGNKGIVVNAGTIDLDCAATNSGSVKWTLHYVPIDSGATVVSS